ncbi:uncharacterized protein LOC120167813 [Hibiscus syriacus]|uniref:uncharacterized protein LOC120167813 n=1 Tax=Hibiscus syriacus TaxID=106335 RepID=UPI001923A576|nr:uncharacterized protein LOC120167813 [Hibiscus syriacus]
MDDYLDKYFSSSQWSDVNVNVKERSSWVHGEPDQPNALLVSSLGVYQDDQPNHTSTQMVDGSLGFGNLGLQFNADVHSSGSMSLQVVGDMTLSRSGNVVCNGGDSSKFRRSLTGLEILSPIPQSWHLQPYDGVLSSLPTLMEQTRMQSSCLQHDNGKVVDDGNYGNINRFVEIGKILQPEYLSSSINAKGKHDAENSLYSSCPADRPVTNTTTVLPSLLQSSSHAPNNDCNGIAKPRVRARRGQATDPHSIAERLRREKIAERMKNLQELVPNSNKTDKASMLVEIIEYVKFLQLQVKVLSMSRLGAAGAVVPLIIDSQAEGSNGLTLTPLVGEGVDYSPSPEQVVFEQEVVKLMESNVTMAMQYLQSKGLCLMPIALAAAISNRKATLSLSLGPASEERKKSGFADGVLSNDDIVHNNTCSRSSSSGTGIHQLTTCDGNSLIEKLNGCNGTFKQEEINTLCTAK